MIKRVVPFLGFAVITAVFFWQFLFKGLLPIPLDTVVGLYHPYRDYFANEYPNGIPFKNFLITDPVRQTYPWRSLSINSFKNFEIPTWNPYSFSGTPNIANFQSAVFYPLNLLLFVGPFEYGWSFLILLQPLLASIFMYLYLRNLKLDEYSSFLGGLIFAFSGFFVTWLEWGTVLHTALWLPLILLAIDKSIFYFINKKKFSIFNSQFPKYFLWAGILIFSSVSSFFAGHLQTFFYLSLLSAVYIIVRIWQSKNIKLIFLFFITWIITAIITSAQLVPTLKFIFLSGRSADQLIWQKEGWFIPLRHFVQFLAPDFFGNPATLNYWGVWNYGELTGYAGITALILSVFAIIYRQDKKTFFYGAVLAVSLFFSISNIISNLPFSLNIPFISTSQPTRLLFITDFSLSVLAALGLNYLIKKGRFRKILTPIIIVGFLMFVLYTFTIYGTRFGISVSDLAVAGRNVLFPGLIFVICSGVLLCIPIVNKRLKNMFLILLILIAVADLFRFSWKFNTFSDKKYLYPETTSIKFIKENIGNQRIATNDPRILAPNFFMIYKIPSVEGYDPLYLERYAELVSAINRNKPDISPPFGFNRIIRVENFDSSLINLLGIKYVLSISEIENPRFIKVFEEGQTKVYENREVLPKAFFVNSIINASGKKDAINKMFDKKFDPHLSAVAENIENKNIQTGNAEITKYTPGEVRIETENKGDGFLVLTDSYYPTWRAMIDDQETKIYNTNYNFRGIFVPKGSHTVIFINSLL